jgi:hypothetical protein
MYTDIRGITGFRSFRFYKENSNIHLQVKVNALHCVWFGPGNHPNTGIFTLRVHGVHFLIVFDFKFF